MILLPSLKNTRKLILVIFIIGNVTTLRIRHFKKWLFHVILE